MTFSLSIHPKTLQWKNYIYIYKIQLPATQNQIIRFFIASCILFLHILLLYTTCCKQFQIFLWKEGINKLKRINRYCRQKETEEKCLSVDKQVWRIQQQRNRNRILFLERLVRRAVPPADKILNDLPFKVLESDQATDSSKLHNWMKSKPQRYGFSSKTQTIPYLSHLDQVCCLKLTEDNGPLPLPNSYTSQELFRGKWLYQRWNVRPKY